MTPTTPLIDRLDLLDLAYVDFPRVCRRYPKSQASVSGAIIKSVALAVAATEGTHVSGVRIARLACCSNSSTRLALAWLLSRGFIEVKDELIPLGRNGSSPRSYRVLVDRFERTIH